MKKIRVLVFVMYMSCTAMPCTVMYMRDLEEVRSEE